MFRRGTAKKNKKKTIDHWKYYEYCPHFRTIFEPNKKKLRKKNLVKNYRAPPHIGYNKLSIVNKWFSCHISFDTLWDTLRNIFFLTLRWKLGLGHACIPYYANCMVFFCKTHHPKHPLWYMFYLFTHSRAPPKLRGPPTTIK